MLRILFVDDDPAFLEEMKFLLQENGYIVDTALDCEEALSFSDRNPVDVVITDMLMGKCNGMEVILHMRAYHPHIKIIAITGGGWASAQIHLDSARLFGSDGCLVKPYPIDLLVAEIERVLH